VKIFKNTSGVRNALKSEPCLFFAKRKIIRGIEAHKSLSRPFHKTVTHYGAMVLIAVNASELNGCLSDWILSAFDVPGTVLSTWALWRVEGSPWPLGLFAGDIHVRVWALQNRRQGQQLPTRLLSESYFQFFVDIFGIEECLEQQFCRTRLSQFLISWITLVAVINWVINIGLKTEAWEWKMDPVWGWLTAGREEGEQRAWRRVNMVEVLYIRIWK
jgi:hypothetical protein